MKTPDNADCASSVALGNVTGPPNRSIARRAHPRTTQDARAEAPAAPTQGHWTASVAPGAAYSFG